MSGGLTSQPSSTSLSRYATARSPGVDVYHGSKSREFCNSFWGGDSGVNVLFARMRGAARTADELRAFWKERAAIEEDYARRLMDLSKVSLGKDEIGEVRNVLDTVRLETEKMAQAHVELTTQIREELEGPTTALLTRHVEHRRTHQAPLEKKFKAKQVQESYVTKAREKYKADCLRITSYSKQIEVNANNQDRLQQKLDRAKQTVQANEKDYRNFVDKLTAMEDDWEVEWRAFCDESQDLEEDRMDFFKDNLWAYANAVSTVCVADDVSCEAIRTVLDQFEGEKDIENFVNEYGTGNAIPEPQLFDGSDLSDGGEPQPKFRHANFPRSRKTGQDRKPLMATSPLITAGGNGGSSVPPQSVAPPPAMVQPPVSQPPLPPPPPTSLAPPSRNGTSSPPRRPSQPLPEQPVSNGRDPVPSPTPPDHLGGGILFYVKALYDYTATIDEEFDFQAGDVIAVTATPDDGWWSGELLDEARREEGRHVFPSNFVCLF